MRGYNNYSYVIDANYQPFSLQEMLTPMLMYKDAYEKSEETFNELTDKADKFKYLSETLPEGSTGRKIYEGYANELNAQAMDLARNGLSMNNRRALTNLKRRYQGEIGRLDLADQALQEEKKLRRQMNAKDSSMLYADDNLSIDQFLDNNTPNLYNISGTELYTRGAAAGKAAASRMYSAGDEGSTLGGYYRDYVQRQGYNPDSLNQFQREMMMNDFTKQVSVLPELQQAAQQILDANGVTQNLTGENLRRAQQQVIRGIVDGSIYDERHNPTRDLGKMTAAERAADSRAREGQALTAALHGMEKDGKGGYRWSADKDPSFQKAKKIAEIKAENGGGSSRSSSGRVAAYDKLQYISYGGNSKENVDEIPWWAKKVDVTIKDGRYVLSVGSGGDKVELGSIDSNGKFEKGKFTSDDFASHFPSHGSLSDWFGSWSKSYDPTWDDATIEALAKDVYETVKREGYKGYENYNYYMESDNSDNENQSGGFYREPMARLMGTAANEGDSEWYGAFGE